MAPSQLIRAAITIGICLCVVTPVGVQSTRPVTLRGYEATQDWFKQVHAHEIGKVDGAVKAVAALPPLTLDRLLGDVRHIRAIVDAVARGDQLDPFRGPDLTLDRLGALLGFTREEFKLPSNLKDLAKPDNPARLAISRVMIQAAMLHTMIAMTASDQLRPDAITWRSGAVVFPPTAIRLQDGRATSVADLAVHWAIAREAMDVAGPPPALSSVLRAWYHGTIAYLQAERNYSALMPHLTHAREVLAADPAVFLFSGAAVENLAAPVVQVALAEAGSRTNVDTPAHLLVSAETYFRRALELEPDFAEARLRLGRVIDLRGRHDEAVDLLRAAESALSTPARRYYAAMYLGQALQAGGATADARAAFERAMTLFPRAQSPRLALAELAWRSGDAAAAIAGIDDLFLASGGAGLDADPWWFYDLSHVGDLPAQLEDMRRTTQAVMR